MKKINNTWKDNIPWIIQQYNKGVNQVDLANEFEFATNTTIRRILLANNVEIRGNGIDQRKVKHNPFNDVSNSNTQYWLGVFSADGCVYKNRIELGSTRHDHLLQYKEFLDCKGVKILSYIHNKFVNSICYSIKFSNTETAIHLNNLGITSTKSHTLKINFPITWDFIRGVMDGDGCVIQHKNKNGDVTRLSIRFATASVDFKDQIVSFLVENNIQPSIYTRENGLFIVEICKQKEVKQMYTNMYKHAPKYFIADKYIRFGEVFGESQE